MPLIDLVLSVLASPTPGDPVADRRLRRRAHARAARGDDAPWRRHDAGVPRRRAPRHDAGAVLSIAAPPRARRRGRASAAGAGRAVVAREAFAALLALLTSARAASGRRFTFLLDEVLDLRTFESFPGLKALMSETGRRSAPPTTGSSWRRGSASAALALPRAGRASPR